MTIMKSGHTFPAAQILYFVKLESVTGSLARHQAKRIRTGGKPFIHFVFVLHCRYLSPVVLAVINSPMQFDICSYIHGC